MIETFLPEELVRGIEAVFEMGAVKHGRDSYLDPDNPSLQPDANEASMARHRKKRQNYEWLDEESGLDHALHEISRLGMDYIRRVRGIESGTKRTI